MLDIILMLAGVGMFAYAFYCVAEKIGLITFIQKLVNRYT